MEPTQVIEPQHERIDISLQFTAIHQTISTFKTNLADLQQQLNGLEKIVKKPTKETKSTKETKPTKETKNIVFDILQEIKPELSEFMKLPTTMSDDGKPITTTTSRNIVTNYITDYIQTHKLQDMNNRKYIHLNEELALLFKLEANEKITYFNIHKYINNLFI